MDLHIDVHEDQFIATTPDMPGCRGIGADATQAVQRLDALLNAATRPPPSPFATVRKRLAERTHAVASTGR